MIRRRAARLVRGLLASRTAFWALCRASGAPLGQKLLPPLHSQRLDVVAAAETRIRLAVGHVRPEAAVLDHDRLAARCVRAELPERWSRPCLASATPDLRLREELERLFQRERQQLFLALERAGLGPHLHERAVAAVLRDDLDVLRPGTQHTRKRQQAECVLEGDRLER